MIEAIIYITICIVIFVASFKATHFAVRKLWGVHIYTVGKDGTEYHYRIKNKQIVKEWRK